MQSNIRLEDTLDARAKADIKAGQKKHQMVKRLHSCQQAEPYCSETAVVRVEERRAR